MTIPKLFNQYLVITGNTVATLVESTFPLVCKTRCYLQNFQHAELSPFTVLRVGHIGLCDNKNLLITIIQLNITIITIMLYIHEVHQNIVA